MAKIIFLIDDDLDDREIFGEALKRCVPDIELLQASDGIEALEFLDTKNVHPDAIFLDVNMPRMNGVETLKELRSRKNTRDLPIIMYTTSGEKKDQNATMLLGADHYFQKTTSFGELCEQLKKLLAMIDNKTLGHRNGNGNGRL